RGARANCRSVGARADMSSSVRRRGLRFHVSLFNGTLRRSPNTAGQVHARWHAGCTSLAARKQPMITALGMVAGFVLTATLLTVATVLAAFQLGRLATRDDEQRQVEAAGAPPNRGRRAAGRPRCTR